ncbi:putative repeat protein (TIGR01451 family) [Xanthomonas sacchari]|uniref:SdrD B-like domain-containing protein n=1 Tax=Xanthomonas sacchari TaxID=56458 RepID=UPI002789AA44|nr:SdrD B-like domain-containing protein [Xanthomonas sacchari]MDQ1091826.1 putative repeat protein (TIGR01451 family) [Xanthomonas sacchari]
MASVERAHSSPPYRMPAPRALLRWLAASGYVRTAARQLLLLSVLLHALPALAAVTAGTVRTGSGAATTGSAPYDSLDAAGNNGDVRSNDTVTYALQYYTDGGDSQVSITSTLPTCAAGTAGCSSGDRIVAWQALPPQCNGNGSGISADGLTLTCVINGPMDAGARSILPVAMVLGNAPNGAVLNPPTTTFTSPQTSTPPTTSYLATDSGELVVTVRARGGYDVVKQPQSNGSRNRWVYTKLNGQDGWVMSYAAGIRAPNGIKGLEPIDGDGVTWSDNLSDIEVTSSNDPNGAAALQNAIRTQGVLYSWPGGNCILNNSSQGSNVGLFGMPNGGTGRTPNQLRDSGTCTATQSGPGAPISVTIKDAPWSGTYLADDGTYFPRQGTEYNDLAPGDNYVAARVLSIWIPASGFDPMIDQANVTITNRYSGVRGRTISGQSLSGDDSANNAASLNFTKTTSIGGGKQYLDIGSSGWHTADGTVQDGSNFGAAVVALNPSSTPVQGLVLCEKLDTTKYQLTSAVAPLASANPQGWADGNVVIEYGTGGRNGVGDGWASRDDQANGTCGNDQSPTWYSNFAAVPGGAARITKVRARVLVPMPASAQILLQVALKATRTAPVAGYGVAAGHVWENGTAVYNYGTVGTSNVPEGSAPDAQGIRWVGLGDDSSRFITSTAWGDVVTLIAARASISKVTLTPANNVNAVVAGQQVEYELRPVLSSSGTTQTTTSLQVRDVLPPEAQYVNGSASLAPSSVQANTPQSGYTTLVWNLPSVATGQSIAPIRFKVDVDVASANARVMPNFTVVSSPLDAGTCQNSGGVYDAILNSGYSIDSATGAVTGTLCRLAARRDLTISNPGGFQISKRADNDTVEPNQPIGYTLRWISVGGDVQSSDLIDVLPYAGDARGSQVSGSTGLAALLGAISGDGSPASTVYYSSAAPGSIAHDPAAPSNALNGGSTRWCTQAQFGSAGCPASPAQVTAVRVVSADGVRQLDGQLRSVRVLLQPQGNAGGDVYSNDFAMRGVSGNVPFTRAVVAPAATTRVVAGALSGKVFRDDNDNGQFDGSDAGIGAVQITLEGCSSGPDGSVQTASVPASGAIACAGDDVSVSRVVNTDAQGDYLFANVASGRYRLVEAQPAGYADGKRRVGSLGGTANAVGTLPSAIGDILVPRQGTGVNYDFAELLTRATLVLRKTSRGGTGSFAFTLGNTVQASGSVATSASDSAVQVDGDNASAGVQAFVVSTLGRAIAITETAAAGWHLSSADSRCSVGGRVVGSLDSASRTYTVPAAEVVGGAEIVCDLVNDPDARITVAKSADPASGSEVAPNDRIGYRLAVNVTGAATTAPVVLTDTLSAKLNLDTASIVAPNGGSCSVAGQVLSCTLAAGTSAGRYVFAYSAKVAADATGAVSNAVVPSGPDNPACVNPEQCQTQHPIRAIFTVAKRVVGTPQLVAGTADEFHVRYRLDVANIGGSAGAYALSDNPQFDPDARILGATSTRGSESAVPLDGAGGWTLASKRTLAAGASESYLLDVHLKVAAGSNQDDDACVAGTAQHGLFNLATLSAPQGTLQDNACVETPKPVLASQLSVEKVGSTRQAEIGDLVSYTVRVRNSGDGIALRPTLVDRLPAGFRLVEGSVRVRGATLLALQGAPGPVLRMELDRIDPGAEVILAYRVRLGVGAMQGDGINHAQAECRTRAQGPGQVCSNESRWKVDVSGGVFGEEGCVVGQVFVDCNGNSVKDPEELGIPGARMYMEDGTYFIADAEGKYSYCGVRPTTHVIKIDPRTLPRGSRMVTSSTRNAADAGSVFVDMKNGELQRADFIEGSCSNPVIEQVKARRAQGEISSVQTEAGQPPLTFESKPAPQRDPLQQGTDSANQPIEQVRQRPQVQGKATDAPAEDGVH